MGEVYVVITTYPNEGNVKEVEILDGPPQWFDPASEHYDEISLDQTVYVGNVNGGDSVPYCPICKADQRGCPGHE